MSIALRLTPRSAPVPRQAVDWAEMMTKQIMIELVECYFAAVDSKNFAAIQTTLTEDCVFTVETHDIRLV